ncbi:tetratricopeptide repeat protein [Flavisphingomonas formosensis]|uniref:tetratricopeptide repeat protein n=1 Tax=Flavisphingomonas formosensis TaxID=861534 RepID=UPI0012FCE4DC|nr:tetratricopeptide repeat protein [Sphingomonas formosensis]
MAVTPQNNDAFFREVDEELRRAQMTSLWQRYGRLAIVVVALGLAALAGYLWWNNHSQQLAGQDGEKLSGALHDLGDRKPERARPVLQALAGSPRAGYRAAADLTLAGMALEGNDVKGAVAAYQRVAADTKLGEPTRDAALLRETMAQFDTLPPAQVVERLKPLAEAGNPWFGTAGEMVAIAYLKMNKPELAGPLYGAIAKNKDVPDSIQRRALEMASMLGVDVVKEASAAAKE